MSGNNLPTFDGPRFARWLRRWKEAEGLDWFQIADRSGVHVSTINNMARGTPARNSKGDFNPPVNTIARLAHGLGLETSYLLRQAGIDLSGERWSNFSHDERKLLAHVMRAHLMTEHRLGLKSEPTLRRLLDGLERSLPETPEDPNA